MDDVTPRRWWLTATAAGAVAVVVSVGAVLAQRPTSDVGRTVEQVSAPAEVTRERPAEAAAPAVEAPPPGVGRSDARPEAGAQVELPVRVEVPSRGVVAEVDAVGVEPDGSMTIPADPDRVGWYRFGPAPGAAQGSVVVAGHVDTARSGPGAFAALVDVQVGEDVVVTSADGSTTTYRVEGRQSVVKDELPTDVLFARDGPPRLVLVTCGGEFLPELRSYRDNLLVTAVPVA